MVNFCLRVTNVVAVARNCCWMLMVLCKIEKSEKKRKLSGKILNKTKLKILNSQQSLKNHTTVKSFKLNELIEKL